MMLYRAPGPEPIQGMLLATLVVADAADLDEATEAGWLPCPAEAQAACEVSKTQVVEAAKTANAPDTQPPTRAELEVKARELGIAFSAKTTDAALGKLIAAKLAD